MTKGMLRGRLAQRRIGGEDDFRWRGEEVSRLESFSDAVFAFAVTLLVVSLEVPDTFDELLKTMRGFFAFAICFAFLFALWHEHYKFFRRYGIRDGFTVCLNAALLFLVVFYVYPLKFLFTLLINEVFGFGGEAIKPGQLPLLWTIYSAGFVAVQLVFILLYLKAYGLREALGLDANEASITREEIQGFSINAGAGLASVAIAFLGGEGAGTWVGLVYLMIFPLRAVHGSLMASRRRKTGG